MTATILDPVSVQRTEVDGAFDAVALTLCGAALHRESEPVDAAWAPWQVGAGIWPAQTSDHEPGFWRAARALSAALAALASLVDAGFGSGSGPGLGFEPTIAGRPHLLGWLATARSTARVTAVAS